MSSGTVTVTILPTILKRELILLHFCCGPVSVYKDREQMSDPNDLTPFILLWWCLEMQIIEAKRSMRLKPPSSSSHNSCSVMWTCDLCSDGKHFSGFPFVAVRDNCCCEGSSCTWWCIIHKWGIPLGLVRICRKKSQLRCVEMDLMDQ